MAGRPKKRIDYAGWSVDIFSNDTKIDKLLDAQGWVGFEMCIRDSIKATVAEIEVVQAIKQIRQTVSHIH